MAQPPSTRQREAKDGGTMKRKSVFLILLALFALMLSVAACGSRDWIGEQETVPDGVQRVQTDGQKEEGKGFREERGDKDGAEADGFSGNEQAAARDGSDGGGTEVENNPPTTKTDADSDGKETIDLAVWDAYEEILSGCTWELISGYVIDESFLAWVTKRYGTSPIFALADAVKAGNHERELWHQLTGDSIHVLWSRYCQETGFQSHALARVYWKECKSPDQTVIDLIGDVNFAEEWSTTRYLDKQVDGLYDCLSPSLLDELNEADLLMVNNEFTYSRRGEPVEGKDYTFRADPDRVYLLEIMGTDIVSLANNHAYDYGPDALLDTMETLKSAGIPYVGAGADLAEAQMPSYFIANGRKIAIVAATQVERTLNYTKEATETEPGVLKTLKADKFVSVITEAKKNADYVIVYVHWGTEQNPYFENDQEQLADAYIEAGADAIIGGHTHCLQGCEYRNGVPIIYSLGNFWFNSNKLDTGIAQLIIQKDGSLAFRFLPCVQKWNQTYLVEEEAEKERIWDYMESISKGVEFDADGYLRQRQ